VVVKYYWLLSTGCSIGCYGVIVVMVFIVCCTDVIVIIIASCSLVFHDSLDFFVRHTMFCSVCPVERLGFVLLKDLLKFARHVIMIGLQSSGLLILRLILRHISL
jgi:hypothetical protein